MLHRWHRRVDRNAEDPGTMRNSMGLKPAQCAMLAGHYNLASELLELQQPHSSGGSESRRRRRRSSASRRRAEGGGSGGGSGGGRGGDLTRDVMLSMMHRAKLLVQLQSLADDERRGMAVLRQRLASGGDGGDDVTVFAAAGGADGREEHGVASVPGQRTRGARGSRRGARAAAAAGGGVGENTELQLLRNTINALQEALQVGALPVGGDDPLGVVASVRV